MTLCEFFAAIGLLSTSVVLGLLIRSGANRYNRFVDEHADMVRFKCLYVTELHKWFGHKDYFDGRCDFVNRADALWHRVNELEKKLKEREAQQKRKETK